jgi:hypothetical protein
MAYKIPGSAFLESGFSAYLSANQPNVTGQGQFANINFNTVLFNVGGNYSAGVYSAPTNGVYHFDLIISFNSPTAAAGREFFCVWDGSPWSTRAYQAIQSGVGDFTITASIDVFLNAGNIMKVGFGVFSNSATDVTIYGTAPNLGAGTQSKSTIFSGYKVSNA